MTASVDVSRVDDVAGLEAAVQSGSAAPMS